MDDQVASPDGSDSSAGLGLDPERFCVGVRGREQCRSCAGFFPMTEDAPPPPRILAHRPWPFEPCPHYVRQDCDSKGDVHGN